MRGIILESDYLRVVTADPSVRGTYPYVQHNDGTHIYTVALDGDWRSFLGMFHNMHPTTAADILRRRDRGISDSRREWRESTLGAGDYNWRPFPDGLNSQPWWVDWQGVADSTGTPLDEIRAMLTGRYLRSLRNRAALVELVASYHGWYELDSYPEPATETEPA